MSNRNNLEESDNEGGRKGHKKTDRGRETYKGRMIWFYSEGGQSIYIFGNLKKENNYRK